MTAVGLGSLRTAGFASSFVGNAAKAGLGGAGFGAVAGAGMSVLNDLDHGGVNGDSFGKALSWGAQGAIGGFKFGSQYGAAGGFGLAGQAIQLRMLVDGAAQGTMSAIDHFQNGEYWSGAGDLAGAFFAAKAAGEHGGRLVADYQSVMGRMPKLDGRMYAISPESRGNSFEPEPIPDPWSDTSTHTISVPRQLLPASSMAELAGRVHNTIEAGNFSNLPTMPSMREILSRLPKNAVVDGTFIPIPNKSQTGVKFKWETQDSNGNNIKHKLRIHDIDPSHPGSNASNGWIFRYEVNGKYYDPTTQSFRHKNVHNPNSPFHDPAAANNTHIPIQTPNQDIIQML
jgi:Bacterial toxin 30